MLIINFLDRFDSYKHTRTRTQAVVPNLHLSNLNKDSGSREFTPGRANERIGYKSPESRRTNGSAISAINTPTLTATTLKPLLRSVYLKPTKGTSQSYLTSQK